MTGRTSCTTQEQTEFRTQSTSGCAGTSSQRASRGLDTETGQVACRAHHHTPQDRLPSPSPVSLPSLPTGPCALYGLSSLAGAQMSLKTQLALQQRWGLFPCEHICPEACVLPSTRAISLAPDTKAGSDEGANLPSVHPQLSETPRGNR